MKDLQLPSIASLRAVAALRSPHLALVRPARIGLGFETATSNQKSLAEVQDLLGGPGRLSLPYALRWLLDAMTGLGVLHRALGFVHGEVRPEHVLLGEDGVGRLLPVVRAHWVRGEARSPECLRYLAPEKLLGDRVDVRSDVYSLGVLLWEALAGQPLLDLSDADAIVARLMAGGVPRAVPPEDESWTTRLAEVAERATLVDPSRRYAGVAEMVDAIKAACSRYLASAPGMAELYQNPQRRARSRVRDSLPPDSQRATEPPPPQHQAAVAESAAASGQAASLAALGQRAQRTNQPPAFEDEAVTLPRSSRPSAPPPSSRKQTLIGVQPPLIERDSSPDSITLPRGSIAPSRPVVLTPLPPAPAARELPPAQPAPAAASPAQAFPLVTPSEPSTLTRSLSPFVATPSGSAAPNPEPSFELVRPRKSRGALWLLLGAGTAVALFAARPWLSRQLTGVGGTLGARPTLELEPNGSAVVTSSAQAPAEAATAESASLTHAAGIASTPAAPSAGPERRAQHPGSREDHVVIDDSLQLQSASANGAAAQPEAASEPPTTTEPPTAAPGPAPHPARPATKPKPAAAPAPEDRYGI